MMAANWPRTYPLRDDNYEPFPLELHPDGTDTLHCKECNGRFMDIEVGRYLGDDCPDCCPSDDRIEHVGEYTIKKYGIPGVEVTGWDE